MSKEFFVEAEPNRLVDEPTVACPYADNAAVVSAVRGRFDRERVFAAPWPVQETESERTWRMAAAQVLR